MAKQIEGGEPEAAEEALHRQPSEDKEKKKKNGSFFWPVTLIVGILVMVIMIAVVSEQRKSTKPKPEVTEPITPPITSRPTVMPPTVNQTQPKVEALVCIAGDLYLHVPPFAPYKLYFRPSDKFVSVPCETRKVEVK